MQSEFLEAFGTSFDGRLETLRGKKFHHGCGFGVRGRCEYAYKTINGNVRYAALQVIRPFVQSERSLFHAYSRSNHEKRENECEQRQKAVSRIKYEAQIGAGWYSKESREQDQCYQTRKSDEIVSSASNKRCRNRIKSRFAKIRNNNALLRRVKAKGNVRPFGGGNVILEEIMYIDSTSITANSYSGYEVLNISPNSPISAAQFPIAQYASSVSISGLEMLQNSSKEAIIDLLDGRMKVAEAQLANRIDYDLYQDGTGNAGKNLIGLAAAVADTPTSGTYGGISRSTWTFWQNQYYSGATNGGAAVSASNIQQYMTTLALRCVRGTNKPDLFVGDSTYYGFYVNSLQAIQRITSADGGGAAGAGFGPELKFFGGGFSADVVLGGGINGAVNTAGTSGGATSAHMWALNTDYIFFRPHKDRNFVPIGGERQAVNQDAVVKLIGWAGNLTSSGPQFCGVLKA